MTKKVNLPTATGADVAIVNEAVAQRIKLYRRQKKISLDVLSQHAGVSKGMLVDIENCKANPSITLLCRIAAAMGVSVADIVNVASEPAVRLIHHDAIPILWRGDKGGSARLLAGTHGPDMVELWQWEMLPSEAFTSPGHPAGTSELLYVTQGSLKLTVGEEEFIINEGNSGVARTDGPHAYACHGSDKLTFIMTVDERQR